jgi:hypothetical protein
LLKDFAKEVFDSAFLETDSLDSNLKERSSHPFGWGRLYIIAAYQSVLEPK